MHLPSKSFINLALVFCVWLGLGFKCSSVQPAEDAQAGREIQKYHSSQLSFCGGEKMWSSYLVKDGRKIPFQAYDPRQTYQQQTPTSEEKARGIVWKYEAWFEAARYRFFEDRQWSEWKTPPKGERMGRATFILEAGRWDMKISEQFIKAADCAEFARLTK